MYIYIYTRVIREYKKTEAEKKEKKTLQKMLRYLSRRYFEFRSHRQRMQRQQGIHRRLCVSSTTLRTITRLCARAPTALVVVVVVAYK